MPSSDRPGQGIVLASWAGTLAFAVLAGLDAAGVDALDLAAVVLPLALFVASLPISLYALARAAVRTARAGERITVPGLFFLRGSAPASVRRQLLGSLVAALAVTVATAWVVPFGVLVCVYPLALCSLWGARHGTFPLIPEPAPPKPRAKRSGGESEPAPPKPRAKWSGEGTEPAPPRPRAKRSGEGTEPAPPRPRAKSGEGQG